MRLRRQRKAVEFKFIKDTGATYRDAFIDLATFFGRLAKVMVALFLMFKNRSEFFATTKLKNNASLERMNIKVCVASVLRVRIPLIFIGNRNLLRNLLHKLGFQTHLTDAGDFAINVMAVRGFGYKPNRLNFGTDLHNAAPKFEILDYGHCVTILKFCTVGIANDFDIC